MASGLARQLFWSVAAGAVVFALVAMTSPMLPMTWDEKIDFATGPMTDLELMQRWGLLKRGWRPGDPGDYRWRVVQRRPPFWSAQDRWLVEHETPAFSKTIRPPTWGLGPWRLDVPLIAVFSIDQYHRARRHAR